MSLALQNLEKVIEKKIPYISGVVPLPEESTKLFFGGVESPGCLDLRKPTADQLDSLVKSCQPATFGRNQEDVLDESYRRAGKLDVSDFGINLDLTKLGLLEKITRFLLMDDRPIHGELYKLNVYGPGSFFKSHKDTPRGTAMFGSLVLVLPTPHEGGELVLRTDGQEMTRYDSSKILAQKEKPSIGYIAFYGDIEHEVLPVTSGNRITLTYNLFFDSKSNYPLGITPIVQHPLLTALKDLFNDPNFLPQGGILGYGLKHEYPVSAGARDLKAVSQNLKGEDALVARVCSTLNVSALVKVIYESRDNDDMPRNIALNFVPDMGTDQYDYEIYHDLKGLKGAIEVHWEGDDYSKQLEKGMLDEDRDDEDRDRGEEIHWFTEPRFNGAKISYIAYGNEATLQYDYGCCCLFIKVESYEARMKTLSALASV